MPEVIKNLLILNGLMFLATVAAPTLGIDLYEHLSLFNYKSDFFRPYQFITHMFMHGGTWHLFLNMFMLWMFGSTLENLWGPKRFLVFYLICGLGAAGFYMLVNTFEINHLLEIGARGAALSQINTPMVGASGAGFGVLLAYGMTFPNHYLLLLFPPIPIKAKYLVLIIGAMQLYEAMRNDPTDNVAYLAHLGGMLFGFLLIKYWQRR